MTFRTTIFGGVWGDRRHQFLQADQSWATCAGAGRCRECNREAKEPYMSDETKAKIRSVLEEHIGPSQADIGDQEDLRGTGKTIEWINVVIALETEFDIRLSEMVVSKCGTIDQIARLIDTIVATKTAAPY